MDMMTIKNNIDKKYQFGVYLIWLTNVMATFKCINEDCLKSFPNASNRLKLEKKSGYLPQRKPTVEINGKWWLEDAKTNYEECSQVYALEIPSFATLISDNSFEPIYIVKIEKKEFGKIQ